MDELSVELGISGGEDFIKPRNSRQGANDHADTDPFFRALAAAPEDTEPETTEEAAAVQAARDEIARGGGISMEEFEAELSVDGLQEEEGS